MLIFIYVPLYNILCIDIGIFVVPFQYLCIFKNVDYYVKCIFYIEPIQHYRFSLRYT